MTKRLPMRHLTVLGAATLSLLLTSGCSLPFEREPASAAPPATTEGAVALEASGAGTVTGSDPGTGTTGGAPAATTPPSQASTHELRYVNPDAPACTVVWAPGAQLAANYEWCRDEDGEPVAGVRIGSCEVVTHRNQMYAVPGQRIMTAIGEIHLDQQFAQLLTSCKRQPYAR